jgi:tetratricopeptide (TPR) repeat protein
MKKLLAAAAIASLLAALASFAVAADRVKLTSGTSSSGRVTEITPNEVTLESGSSKKKFAVNEIEWIQFESEPAELTQGRAAANAGRYEDAVALLHKVDPADLKRPEMAQDAEYFKAFVAARLALAGAGSKADAGRNLLKFEKAHQASWHYYEACETLGDLFAALGKFDQAESFYAKLAVAAWPDYKLRSGVLVGRALVSQKRFDQAIEKFDEVLSASADGKEADRLKLSASLGKAAAMAGAGKTEGAIQAVQAVIAKADPENQELHARAYNILGNCYLAANKKKEALLAFLHVDLLYARYPEQHAEALANLATLWAEQDKSERAAQARNLLKEKYPTSAWAEK